MLEWLSLAASCVFGVIAFLLLTASLVMLFGKSKGS